MCVRREHLMRVCGGGEGALFVCVFRSVSGGQCCFFFFGLQPAGVPKPTTLVSSKRFFFALLHFFSFVSKLTRRVQQAPAVRIAG